MAKRYVQFQITERQHKELRKFCAEADISISDLMREAAKVYLSPKDQEFLEDIGVLDSRSDCTAAAQASETSEPE